MKTGDLLLFKGNSVISRFIIMLPGAGYSHVGFYYEHPILGPCVFESTSIGNDPDVFTGKIIEGVQVTRFSDRIKNYDGDVYVRSLRAPLTSDQLVTFTDLVKKLHGIPYEKSNWQLMKAELDGLNSSRFKLPWFRNEQDESTLFCSEMCTRVVVDVKIAEDDGEPTNEQTPTDCAVKWPGSYKLSARPLKIG